MLKKPQLINSKFVSFQWNSKKFSGIQNNTKIFQLNSFFLRSVENFYIKTKHIDMLTRYSKWKLKKKGWLIFPIPCTYPLTKKPTEVRMGKGKGGIYDWAIPLKKGSNFIYINSQNSQVSKTLLVDLKKKLPIKSKISIMKHDLLELTPQNLSTLKSNYYLNKIF